MKEFLSKYKGVVLAMLALIIGAAAGVTTTVVVRPQNNTTTVDAGFSIELSEEQVPAVVINEEGEEEIVDVPTVEAVDGNDLIEDWDKPLEKGGLGSYFNVDISSPATFKNSTLGRCIDTDGFAGAQCWDLNNAFWVEYTGRWLSTCGTGAAKGTLNCWEYNAGDEFDMIWDANQIKEGDQVVFTNGQWGHIGVAAGPAVNGYVALLGRNQGGTPCPGGGSSTNIINISLKYFGGAFRPKIYVEPEPEPEPAPEPTSGVDYIYVEGDTFGQVLLNLGLATADNLWGPDGMVEKYNAQLLEQGILNYYDGKYWNNIPVGTTIHLEA